MWELTGSDVHEPGEFNMMGDEREEMRWNGYRK